jgi:GntR family transcriptional regulator
MLDVKIERDGDLPLHEQVAAAIRHDISAGDVRPGGRLPPARDMAAVLGVHPNTVLRALRMLRDEGVLEFRRGRVITVVDEPAHGIVVAQAVELLRLASHWGLRREDVVALIEGLP